MKVILAGAGAFGVKHLDAIQQIGGVDVVSVIGRELAADAGRGAQVRRTARHHQTSPKALAQPGVDAVILATPTQMHAAQALQCLEAGKHVQVEIPLADSWKDAEAVAQRASQSGLVAMVGHTRRFNPSHQWVHRRIMAGEISLQQMDVQTYFFRRTNINALGQPRSWTDHLLWHHAAHTVDLFRYQARSEIVRAHAVGGAYPPRSWASPWTCPSSCRRRTAPSAPCR